jgi:hypothetical protein
LLQCQLELELHTNMEIMFPACGFWHVNIQGIHSYKSDIFKALASSLLLESKTKPKAHTRCVIQFIMNYEARYKLHFERPIVLR